MPVVSGGGTGSGIALCNGHFIGSRTCPSSTPGNDTTGDQGTLPAPNNTPTGTLLGRATSPSRVVVNGRLIIEKFAPDDAAGALDRSPGSVVDYLNGTVYFDPLDQFLVQNHNSERTLDGEDVFSSENQAQTSEAGKWVTSTINDEWSNGAQVRVAYVLDSVVPTTEQDSVAVPPITLDLLLGFAETVIPETVAFAWGDTQYYDVAGKIYRDFDMITGAGIEAGTINYSTSRVVLTNYTVASGAISIVSIMTRFGTPPASEIFFRTPGAPIRPGGLSISATASDGTELIGSADFDGNITGTKMRGFVDSQSGVVRVEFGEVVNSLWEPQQVIPGTIKYNAVIFIYIPLDPNILGLDPVRLPINGEVPIFRPGDVAVLHNTQQLTMPDPLAANEVISMTRTDLAQAVVYDASGLKVDPAQYAVDLIAGTVTMDAAMDLTGFVEPFIAQHRIEQMFLVSDVEIGGRVSTGTAVARDYPIAGTYLSSALVIGDMQSRTEFFFSQQTWQGNWLNVIEGNSTTAQYNDLDNPIEVQNDAAIDQRWAIIFTSSTAFNVVGETVGQIASGTIAADIAVTNPLTGQAYFTMRAAGWGSGWSTGNVVRFNTVGANAPVWIARTTLQGPPTEPNDEFVIEIRGDADV